MISIQSVSKSFGPQQVLSKVSFDIPEGKTIAVVGPSGVGKSVLLKIIMGLYSADEGSIEIDGENICELQTEAELNRIRSGMGVLFQSAALLDSISLYDNIAFPLRYQIGMDEDQVFEKVRFMLESLSLAKFANKFPQEVSLGIRKRVGMARALVSEPKVFLLDEPNTGLDPMVGQEVYDLISLCKEKWNFTGVVISHELPEVFQVSDYVAMLLDGKLILYGTPQDFLNCETPAVRQFLEGNVDGPIRIN